MERKQFTFYKSFYTAIRRFKRKSDRCDAYEAMFEYVFFGVMPELEKLSPGVASNFELIQPTLDAGRKKAENGIIGGRIKPTESKPKANRKQTGSKTEANGKQDGSEKEVEIENEIELENELEYECIYSEIVAYLNSKTGKAYRPSSRRTRSAIHARLEEGFALEDFRAVIDRKCADWLKDPKMEEYLRPETLFGPKFESYLNAGGNHGTIAGLSDENRVGHYL